MLHTLAKCDHLNYFFLKIAHAPVIPLLMFRVQRNAFDVWFYWEKQLSCPCKGMGKSGGEREEGRVCRNGEGERGEGKVCWNGEGEIRKGEEGKEERVGMGKGK